MMILLPFLLASLALALTPGPGVLYIVTRALTQGRRAGLASVAGVALGNLGNAVGAALGLAALFALSAMAFTVVKLAGAAYLVYLGVKALRAPTVVPPTTLTRVPVARLFRDGLLVALFNPKTTLFFAAFLPQFINAETPAPVQMVALGALFVAIAATTDLLYALATATLAPRLPGRGHPLSVGRYLTATLYIGLGLYTATSGSRSQ